MRARRRLMAESTSLTRLAPLCLLALAGLFSFTGCAGLGEDFSATRLATPYRQTRLMGSNTLDVLALTESPEYQFTPEAIDMQLLSQSDRIVALSGRTADKLKTWVNLIAFDERRMAASRKYFFYSDENAANGAIDATLHLLDRRKGLYFDAQLVLDKSIRSTPYATEEARQTAIVRWLAGRFQQDVRDLTHNEDQSVHADELVTLAGWMMNQTFEGVLTALRRSPGLARNLTDARGAPFDHVSLDRGRIRVVVVNDVVTVKVRVSLPMVP